VTLKDINAGGGGYGKAMFTLYGLFYLDWKITTDTSCFAVFYAGHEHEAAVFKHKLKICPLAQKCSISGLCRSYLQEKHQALKPG
jgi:hypothetical protein